MRRDLFSSSISDERTRKTFIDVYKKYQLLLEPHGAVAWCGFEDWLKSEGGTQMAEGGSETKTEDSGPGTLDFPVAILETANPAKFPEEIEKAFGWSPDVPPAMEITNQLPEDFDQMDADYEKFKAYLLQKHA
jgi:threonine synthase